MGTTEWVVVLFLRVCPWVVVGFHSSEDIVGCVSLVSLASALFLVTEIPLFVFVSCIHLGTLHG
jgi:hypothetical protein